MSILTEAERVALVDLVENGTEEEQAYASAILNSEQGILPPPEAVEWFVKRFR